MFKAFHEEVKILKMSVCSHWNSFTRQQQKDTFHNFAAQAPLLPNCVGPLETFSKISHLFPYERSRTYSTLVRRNSAATEMNAQRNKTEP